MIKKILSEFLIELKRVFSDPGSILILVLAATMYSSVYSLPYSTEVIVKVPIGVCDNDNTGFSRDLVQKIESNPYLKIVSRPLNLEVAKKELSKQKIYAFVDIPNDFASDVKKNSKTTVSLYTDSGYLIVYRQILSNMTQIVGTLSKKIEIKNIVKEIHNYDKAIETAMPFELAEITLFNPSGGYESYIFPAVLILILQQTMLVGIGLLGGTYRERGHFKKIEENEIETKILGRACAYVLIYLAHSFVYFLLIPHIYNFTLYYNYSVICCLLLPYLFSVAFLGQALIIFMKRRESSLMALVVLSLPLAFLPGIIWPKESIPELLRALSLLLPSTTAMDSIVKVNQMGATFAEVRYSFLWLLLLSIIYFFAAVKTYKFLRNNDKQ